MSCEDYPCCGHEFGCCPSYDESGNQLDMVCTCGKRLPIKSRYSICDSCMDSEDDCDEEMYFDDDCEMEYVIELIDFKNKVCQYIRDEYSISWYKLDVVIKLSEKYYSEGNSVPSTARKIVDLLKKNKV